ncbi:unnamed protein product [Periconia digitata]|uniref:Clr5 domain-containing protein n=1 Tax=Periconia digitata TaxID=1303443 RepID=A0A9W4URU2_9PLEO|nr:unnamed protein product [Periconia digitata]
MVINWDGMEADCHRMYVQENKNLKEVIGYWEQRGFTASPRAYNLQFKRWNFPLKQHPVYKNEALIARVKELWDTNHDQTDMLEVLHAEGFSIRNRELINLRHRHRWTFRAPTTGSKQSQADGATTKPPKKRKKQKPQVVYSNSLIDQLANAIMQGNSSGAESEEETEPDAEAAEVTPAPTVAVPVEEAVDEEKAARLRLRQEQLIAESEEKWRAGKRRRRTQAWACLPADAPDAPPRFPSETTIDECKAQLNLDNTQYKAMRERFQSICEEQDVTKKTVAGPEMWASLVQRLIRENPHLSDTFKDDSAVLEQSDAMWKPKDSKSLSLDVICQDVTKSMRVMNSRMGVSEVKDILGLNPQQTRQARTEFISILQADHFTNKFLAGPEHWNELKRRWVQGSNDLPKLLDVEDASEQQDSRKLRALEVLARTAMRQFRAVERTSGQRPKQVHQGPGPGPAKSSGPPTSARRKRGRVGKTATSAATELSNTLPPSTTESPTQAQASTSLQSHTEGNDSFSPGQSLQFNSNAYIPVMPAQPPILESGPLAIYFRLHALSSTPYRSKSVWLSILENGTLAEVKSLAMREHPGTTVVRLEGLIMHEHGEAGREIAISIGDDAELSAFLGHVNGGKVTFVVLLSAAGNDGFFLR